VLMQPNCWTCYRANLLFDDAGWAGDTMSYSVNSQASNSVSVNGSDSDVNSDTEADESGVKTLNTTCVLQFADAFSHFVLYFSTF